MPRPFFETLRELRGGTTLEELGNALADVVSAVEATGKPGTLVLKLTVRPPRKGSATASYLTIEDDVTTKVPRRDREDTVFFPLADGSLSRQDPRQRDLDLKGVDTSTGEITDHQRSA
jgi:hypothetical protein